MPITTKEQKRLDREQKRLERMLEKAQAAQQKYWDVLGELEQALGFDLDAEKFNDLSNWSLDTLLAENGEDDEDDEDNENA